MRPRHSTASAPWPGAGSIWIGSMHLGDRVEPAEPGQPGPGEHDGVELTVGDERDPGVDVAAHGDDLEAEAERAQLRGPARRAGADRGPGGSSPRVSPSRATSTSRGSSRSRHGGERPARGWARSAGP